MLFNSWTYLIFLPTVIVLYYGLPHKARWPLLFVASCIFYAAFVPEYLLILFAVVLIDYFSALMIERSPDERRRRLFLGLSVFGNLGILFVFKYFNFFISNFQAMAEAFGFGRSTFFLEILLPIGLSFHVFQSLSYTIEVYYRRFRAERNLGIFAVYVLYFPQMVAGPIERPQNILPQLHQPSRFSWSNLRDGLDLILWGLFQKVVVADNLAVIVDRAYGAPEKHNGNFLFVATIYFSFQIYCDFAGYSNIARGSSRILGIELMKNFNYPYISRSVAEFWTRWHISLSGWFRDYVYIPLGGNRVSPAKRQRNVWIVFLTSGLWHGANWTFVVWGGLHALLVSFEGKIAPRISWPRWPLGQQVRTFLLVSLAWIFFRANSVGEAGLIISKIFTWSDEGHGHHISAQDQAFFIFVPLMLYAEWLFRNKAAFLQKIHRRPWLHWAVYVVTLLTFYLFGHFSSRQFIYFQF